jgi:hypothetical protein
VSIRKGLTHFINFDTMIKFAVQNAYYKGYICGHLEVSQMATPGIPDEFEAEQHFKRKLMELGLLKNITIPSGKPEGRRTPIKVKGKPTSQAIIENRW